VAATFTDADLAYIRTNYLTLVELCAGRSETPEQVHELIEQELLPRPSYVLDDGTGMFPTDYFVLVDEAGGPAALRPHFAARYRAASASREALQQDWEAYMAGIYGVCLCAVSPETIVRKSALVTSLCELLVLASPQSREWRERLRAQVDELDALEREFTPDYDRSGVHERPPTRDLLIKAAHAPEVFT
jgi:uncharacterized protein DUF6058